MLDQKFSRHDAVVPEHIMGIMRQRRYLDEDDTSEDEEILSMDGVDFLQEWLEWEGISGYTFDILTVIEMAFGVDLQNYPFNETIRREISE